MGFKTEKLARSAGEDLLKVLNYEGFTVRVWENGGYHFTLIKQVDEGGYHDISRIEIYPETDHYWIDSRIAGHQYYCKNVDMNNGVKELYLIIKNDIENRQKDHEKLFDV